MNQEQLEAIGETVEFRAQGLIEKEGDLGRLAFSVANAYRSLEIMAHNSSLPGEVVSALGSVIIESLIFAVGSEPNTRFAAVYEQANRILEDAESAAKSSRSLDQTVRDILSKAK